MKTRVPLECGLRRPLRRPPSFPSVRCGPMCSFRSGGRCSDAYLSTPSPYPPPFFSTIPVHSPHRCDHHQLGAPNSRVTRDALLAWPGRARLLGAQMMYADYSLSLFLSRARSCGRCSLRFLYSLFFHVFMYRHGRQERKLYIEVIKNKKKKKNGNFYLHLYYPVQI